MILYNVVKFLHVFLAMVAVGFNTSYGYWIVRGRKDGASLGFVLKGIKTMDNRIANPCYLGLLVTGPMMISMSHIPWGTLWVWLSASLFGLVLLLGWLVYTPTLRGQIEALAKAGKDSADYLALDKKGKILGMIQGLTVAVIVFLMVTKPS